MNNSTTIPQNSKIYHKVDLFSHHKAFHGPFRLRFIA